MFYYLINKLHLIKGDNKMFKIFILGTICYIILHAFLFSKRAESFINVAKYRKYIYYIMGADLAFTYLSVKNNESNVSSHNHTNTNAVHEQHKQHEQQDEHLHRQQQDEQNEQDEQDRQNEDDPNDRFKDININDRDGIIRMLNQVQQEKAEREKQQNNNSNADNHQNNNSNVDNHQNNNSKIEKQTDLFVQKNQDNVSHKSNKSSNKSIHSQYHIPMYVPHKKNI